MPGASERLSDDAVVPPQVLERFRMVSEWAPDATLICHPGGRVLLANARAEAMFGYAAGEMAGLAIEALIPERLRAPYRRERDAYAVHPVAREMISDGDLAGLRKDGTTFPAEISLLPIDAGGGITIVSGAVRDITDRRRLTEQLRAGEERFRMLVDQSSDGIFISDAAGHYQEVNPAGCVMLGFARQELLRMSISDVLDPDERPRLADEMHRLRSGQPLTSEWRFRRKDGSTFFGEVNARQLSDTRLIANTRDVSARRAVEQELRASQRFIETVAKASPPVIYVFDLDESRLTYENRSILGVLGYVSSDSTITTLEDFKAFMPADELHHLEDVIEEWHALPNGHMREDEYRLRDAQSVTRWFHGRETVFARHDDGTVRQILGTLYDITNRKQAEQALEHSRYLLKSFVEHTPVAVAMLDRDLRYVAVSRRWLQDYGLGDRDLTGRYHYDVFPEIRNMPDWQRVHRRSLAGSVERRDKDLFVRADGRTHWLRWEVRPWRDEDGAIGGIIMFTEVITDRVLAEAQLRESQAHLLASQHVAGVGSWEIDLAPGTERRARSPLKWSDECFRVFGYTPGEVALTHDVFWDHVHPADRSQMREAIRNAIERRQPLSVDHRIVVRNGVERLVHEQAELLLSPQTGHALKLIGTVQDITERRRLEDQLRQSQKLQAVGQIAGGVAHDFNNVLTVIGGVTEMLLERLPADHTIRDEVMTIRDAANHAASLTRQLLLFSRKAVLEPRVLDCNALVGRTIRLLGRVIGEDKTVSVAFAPALPHIKADPSQIEQVVMNLVLNARDATPAGGRLTIQTALASFTPEQCRDHPEYIPGRFVQIIVADSGRGMTDDVKKHVFEPFFTTKRQGTGTGLGLATVYGIVRESGGFITFSSDVGVGTTFNVFLPAHDEAVSSDEVASTPARNLRGTETVLLVEDDANLRWLSKTILQKYGYTVLEASDGMAALRIADSRTEPINLVLSDVIMPEMSGPALVQTLAGRGRVGRVLFMSGYAGESLASVGPDQTSVPLLAKPFTPQELAAKVRDVLDEPR